MDDFKPSAKMQCFREGGSVKYKSRHSEKSEMSEDVSKDKKIVKKAFAMHDKQEHPGEKTDLSKLRKGGRAKKECGTVKKYKAGGNVENAYGTPKTKKDIKDIANAKNQKPKKMQFGGMSAPMATAPSAPMGQGQMSDLEKRRMAEKKARAQKYLGPSQIDELIKQDPSAAGMVPPPPSAPMMRKNGGSVKMKDGGCATKKMNTGGTCS
jgi:seryl-tRNA synthetase